MRFTSAVLLLVSLQIFGFALPALDPEVAIDSFTDIWNQMSRHRQNTWVEQLGEAGGRAYAESQGWSPLFLHSDGGIPQGFDQVYITENGSIVAIEVKGGVSRLQTPASGYMQGTIEYTLDAAVRLLRSPSANLRQIQAAREVLRSGVRGELQSVVVRTPHVNGQPTSVRIERVYSSNRQTRQMAQGLIDDLASGGIDVFDDIATSADEVFGAAIPIQGNSQGFAEASSQLDDAMQNTADDVAASLDDAVKNGLETIDDPCITLLEQSDDGIHAITSNVDDAARQLSSSRLTRASQLQNQISSRANMISRLRAATPVIVEFLAVAGIAADGYFRIDQVTELQHEYLNGNISQLECETIEVRAFTGFVGGMYGALEGAKLGALAGGSIGSLFPGAGNVVGGIAGGIVGGVGGYIGGEKLVQALGDKMMYMLHYRGESLEAIAMYLSSWASTDLLASKMQSIGDGIYLGSGLFWQGIDSGEQWAFFYLKEVGDVISTGSDLFWEGIESGGGWTYLGMQKTSETAETTSDLFFEGLESGRQYTGYYLENAKDYVDDSVEEAIIFWFY